MIFTRTVSLLLTISIIFLDTRCQSYQLYQSKSEVKHSGSRETESTRNLRLTNLSNFSVEGTLTDNRKIERMLGKAILKIIFGNLSKADIHLLRSLNYSIEEILEIRRRTTIKNEKIRERDGVFFSQDLTKKTERTNQQLNNRAMRNETFSVIRERELEEYNKQAVYDYENMLAKIDFPIDSKQIEDYEELSTVSKSTQPSTTKRETLYKTLVPDSVKNKFNSRINPRNNLIHLETSSKSSREFNFTMGNLSALVHLINIVRVASTDYWREKNVAHSSANENFNKGTWNESNRETMSILVNYSDIHYFPATLVSNFGITENKFPISQDENYTSKLKYDGLEWIEDDIEKGIMDKT